MRIARQNQLPFMLPAYEAISFTYLCMGLNRICRTAAAALFKTVENNPPPHKENCVSRTISKEFSIGRVLYIYATTARKNATPTLEINSVAK